MPYSSVNDLPQAVKKLDSDKQRQWMHVFNTAYEKCVSEGGKNCDSVAARQAWGVVSEHVKETALIFDIGKKLNESALPNGNYRISGEAIHPVRTYHPYEWGTLRDYIEPYLTRAAPTLVGAPLVIDHSYKLPSENRITKAWWDSDKSAVMFEGEVTPEVYAMFKSGELTSKVSIGADYLQPGGGFLVGEEGEYIFYGFDFFELSLISRGNQPGDPMTTIQVWESLIRESKESINKNKNRGGKTMNEEKPITQEEVKALIDESLKDIKEKLEKGTDLKELTDKLSKEMSDKIKARFEDNKKTDEKTAILETAKAYPKEVQDIVNKALEVKEPEEGKEPEEPNLEEVKKVFNAYFKADEMKELPNEAYALVIAEEGKDKVSLYPHHNKEGKLNKEVLMRSLDEVTKLKPSEDLTKETIETVKTHLMKHCKDEGWENEAAGITKESMLVDLRKQLFDMKDKVSIAETKVQDAEAKRIEDISSIGKMLEDIIPRPIVTLSHRPASGFTRLVEQVKRVKLHVDSITN